MRNFKICSKCPNLVNFYDTHYKCIILDNDKNTKSNFVKYHLNNYDEKIQTKVKCCFKMEQELIKKGNNNDL